MGMSNDEYRDLTRRFLTESLTEQVAASGRVEDRMPRNAADPGNYGPSQSGDPQSYTDFHKRLDAIASLVEELSMDYVDSQWLADGDHASLATAVDKLFGDSDSLSMTALSLAQSQGEI